MESKTLPIRVVGAGEVRIKYIENTSNMNPKAQRTHRKKSTEAEVFIVDISMILDSPKIMDMAPKSWKWFQIQGKSKK